MNNLKYVSDNFLDEFKSNFDEKYLQLYKEDLKEEIEELFNNSENVIKSEKTYDYKELVYSKEKDGLNIENIKIIEESFKQLTPAEASNEKLWVALENTDYLDFHLNQLKFAVNKSNLDTSIKGRTIFTQGSKRSLAMNNLSMLWWIGYYTIDHTLDNPYYYAEYILDYASRGDILMYLSSNIVSNKEIVIGTLEGIKHLIEEGKMERNRYSFTNSNKILNQIGGVRIIDTLNRDEVQRIIIDNLLDTEKIKVVG